MVDEATPEEKQQVACEVLFEDMENAIYTARRAGIDKDEITKIFTAALSSVRANAITPEEEQKWRAEIQRESDEWEKAHPEVGPPPPME